MSPRYDCASLFMKYHSMQAMPSAVFCQGGSSAKGVEGSCSFSFPSVFWLVAGSGRGFGWYVCYWLLFFPFFPSSEGKLGERGAVPDGRTGYYRL